MSKYGYYIEGKIGNDVFPHKFSNQIFFSDHVTDFNLEYETVYSIKYQISGSENYKFNNKRIVLPSNNFLVVNNNQKITCNSGTPGEAISIFIDPATMNDVFDNCVSFHENLLDKPFSTKNDEVIFHEKVYPLGKNLLTRKLQSLSSLFTYKNIDAKSFGINFFFDISRALILTQKDTLRQIRNIDCIKTSTKKELYNRMVLAKEFIIENWNKALTIEKIAKQVFMSPYHFHRIFTSTFRTTPLKFHSDIKMKKITELLDTGKYSITDIALMSGYSDIFSFSKAFKKKLGFAPSKLLNIS